MKKVHEFHIEVLVYQHNLARFYLAEDFSRQDVSLLASRAIEVDCSAGKVIYIDVCLVSEENPLGR